MWHNKSLIINICG